MKYRSEEIMAVEFTKEIIDKVYSLERFKPIKVDSDGIYFTVGLNKHGKYIMRISSRRIVFKSDNADSMVTHLTGMHKDYIKSIYKRK